MPKDNLISNLPDVKSYELNTGHSIARPEMRSAEKPVRLDNAATLLEITNELL